MALPLEILAYGSHKKRKCVIEYECKFSIPKIACIVARRPKNSKNNSINLSILKKIKEIIYVI